MMRYLSRSTLSGILAGLLMLAGCSASPPHYYLLNAVVPAKLIDTHSKHIVLLQVKIPQYLDRSYLVSRDDDSQLHIAELHQWSGQLRQNIARVLVENLSGTTVVVAAPLPAGMQPDLSLVVSILKFERQPDGHVQMGVQWHLLSKGKALVSHSETLTGNAHLAPRDYMGMTHAMSELLGKLSAEIATAIVDKGEPRMNANEHE